MSVSLKILSIKKMCFQNNDSSHFIHFLTENPVEEFHEKEGAVTVRYDWGKI